MPRQGRSFVEGGALHIVQRGNNRSACFVDDADRVLYLGMLGELASKTRCAVHAYVLMTNHVHMLVTPEVPTAPSSLMQRLGMRFAAYANRRYGRTGTLWEGRFRASAIATEAYVLACHRYIELNPVRAGIVDGPEQYRWSSHGSNIGKADRGFLVFHPTVAGLAATTEAATRTYQSLFDTPLGVAVLTELRHGIAQHRGQIQI